MGDTQAHEVARARRVKYGSAEEFMATIRHAPYLSKVEFVRSRVAGKRVLDLGCVQHSLERMQKAPERWLHNVIRKNAASVLGIDILEKEIDQLHAMGYEVRVGDATSLRLSERFDVVVCGDLIEHLVNPGDLLETMRAHLNANGVGLVTTPNPFGANRFLNLVFDGWTGVNSEHTCWFCPHTLYLLARRCGLRVEEFCWLETAFPSETQRPYWRKVINPFGRWLMGRNQLLRLDFGVVLAAAEGELRHG